LVLAVAALGGWHFRRGTTAATSAGRPRLVAPTRPLDLGRGKTGRIVDGSFRLVNSGSAPLKYTLGASCGCSELSPSVGTIGPGDFQDIHVGIRLGAPGTDKNVQVTIESNDPDRPTVTHTVLASCPAVLSISPAVIDFGRMKPGQALTRSIRIRDRRNQPLDANEAGRLLVRTNRAFLTATPIDRSDGEFMLSVTLGKDAPRGYLSGEVRIIPPDDPEGLAVPIVAEVIDPISVAPVALFLEADGKTGRFADARFLVSRSDGGRLESPLEVSAPPGFRVVERTGLGAARKLFEVKAGDVASLTAPGVIRLRFPGVPEQIQVVVHPPLAPAGTPGS
jgi:hypothetical protein